MGDASQKPKRLRILLAEDELLVAADIEAMLEGIGCQVVGPIATVDEIARIARSEPLDGAVLDVNLRGSHVFEVLPILLERRIPVVLSSGYEDRLLHPEAFRELPLLVKPYDAAELERVITEVLGPRSPI